MRELFEMDALLETAAEAMGTEDFGGNGFKPALAALLPALADEAGLHPARVWRTVAQVLDTLELRARLAAKLREDPGIANVHLEAPVFITGLPRTGTTLLHNLLSSLPGWRGWALWEMRCLLPESNTDGWQDLARAETSAILRELYARIPGFSRIHPMHADRPDECNWLFRNSFASLVYALQFHVPSYARWMIEQHQGEAYREFATQLRILRARHPEGRMVMKDPCHLFHLDALLETFPDATVVVLHRDVAEAVPSLASLCHHLHAYDSTATDVTRTGGYAMDLAERGLARLRDVRARFPRSRLVDVHYVDLVRDPVETVARLCNAVAQPLDEEGVRAMAGWLATNRQHKAGKHVYRARDFGLDAEMLRTRLAPSAPV